MYSVLYSQTDLIGVYIRLERTWKKQYRLNTWTRWCSGSAYPCKQRCSEPWQHRIVYVYNIQRAATTTHNRLSLHSTQYPGGDTAHRGVESRGMKNLVFRPIFRFILEMIQDRATVTNASRKPYPDFPKLSNDIFMQQWSEQPRFQGHDIHYTYIAFHSRQSFRPHTPRKNPATARCYTRDRNSPDL